MSHFSLTMLLFPLSFTSTSAQQQYCIWWHRYSYTLSNDVVHPMHQITAVGQSSTEQNRMGKSSLFWFKWFDILYDEFLYHVPKYWQLALCANSEIRFHSEEMTLFNWVGICLLAHVHQHKYKILKWVYSSLWPIVFEWFHHEACCARAQARYSLLAINGNVVLAVNSSNIWFELMRVARCWTQLRIKTYACMHE